MTIIELFILIFFVLNNLFIRRILFNTLKKFFNTRRPPPGESPPKKKKHTHTHTQKSLSHWPISVVELQSSGSERRFQSFSSLLFYFYIKNILACFKFKILVYYKMQECWSRKTCSSTNHTILVLCTPAKSHFSTDQERHTPIILVF